MRQARRREGACIPSLLIRIIEAGQILAVRRVEQIGPRGDRGEIDTFATVIKCRLEGIGGRQPTFDGLEVGLGEILLQGIEHPPLFLDVVHRQDVPSILRSDMDEEDLGFVAEGCRRRSRLLTDRPERNRRGRCGTPVDRR